MPSHRAHPPARRGVREPAIEGGPPPRLWHDSDMRVPIDEAGRLVIPKQLRDEVGLEPEEVELYRDGAGIRIEPVAESGLVEEDGLLVIPPSGIALDDDRVRSLRSHSGAWHR